MGYKFLKSCVSSLILCVFFETQAFACFEGYEIQKYELVGILGPVFVFSDEQGETIQKVMTDMGDSYSLVSSPLTGSLSYLMKQEIAIDHNSWEGRKALYFTELSVVKYSMLLELVRVSDPCAQQKTISLETRNKIIREGYLDSVAMPPGYRLATYKKRTKKSVEQVVILIDPQHPQSDIPFPPQMIVSRAFYPIEMESYLKPYLIAYLEANIPSWTAQPIELPDAD